MVNHLAGHAAVDANVFAGNESGLVAGKIKHHVGDIQRVADAACGLLRGIGAFVDLEIRIDPARRNGRYYLYDRANESFQEKFSGEQNEKIIFFDIIHYFFRFLHERRLKAEHSRNGKFIFCNTRFHRNID